MNWGLFHKLSSNRIIKKIYVLGTYACAILPDKAYLRFMYRIRTGHNLNLENPVTFNEKIQFMKLYEKNKGYYQYVDKYMVREYISKEIGKEHLIPLIGVYDRFEDIDFDELPTEFVVKCTHDSGSVVVCDSKEELVRNRKKLKKALKRKYYFASRDYTYKGTIPRLIIEQKLENEAGKGLTDYKFYCFDGVPRYLYISEGLQDHSTARISFYNMDFTVAPFRRSDYKPLDRIPSKPKQYDQMLRIAEKLSKGFTFVRVDLYEVDDRVYFSELTFAPCGGYMPFEPKEFDKVLGDLLNLPKE